MIYRKCPKCGMIYSDPPALSREDNKTEICPTCGVIEALKDYKKYKEQKIENKGVEDGNKNN